MSDIRISYKSDLASVMPALRKRMVMSVTRGVMRASQQVAGEVRKSIKAKLGQRTGALGRSFRATMFATKGDDISGGAFSSLSYAQIQDEGGTIKPRTRQYLAVPISTKAKRTVGLWPRHWAKGVLFLIRSRAGKLLLVERKARGLQVHYLLTKSVSLRGKNYIGDAETRSAPMVQQILSDYIARAAEAT